MAFITLTEDFNGHRALTLPEAKAREVQAVKDGTVRGTAAQKAFAKIVKKIYFAKPSSSQLNHIEQVREVFTPTERRDLI